MALLIDIVSWLLVVGGSLFYLIGGIGLYRMPDVFTRMHAHSVSETLGAGALFAGMLLQAGWSLVALKLVILFAVIIYTGPVATHAVARAARFAGVEPMLNSHKGAGGSKR